MKVCFGLMVIVACLVLGSFASAATFGTGANEFTIDFVTISGATNPASGYGIVNNDYRMGMHEITNDQWSKFKASVGGTVTGSPSYAYDSYPYFTGARVPTNNVSWYEAAQFVNWLNTSTGYQAAYRFTGTQGTADYTLSTWDAADAAGVTNLYRHKDAYYFLPPEHEWVKAAYWNGTNLQTYAAKPSESLMHGDGTSGIGWNYYSDGSATKPTCPWDVGSGSEELNGTYDMMGNVWEWMESPYSDTSYGTTSSRACRGGAFYNRSHTLASSARNGDDPAFEYYGVGFRVASSAAVAEPGSLIIWACGGFGALLLKRRRK